MTLASAVYLGLASAGSFFGFRANPGDANFTCFMLCRSDRLKTPWGGVLKMAGQ
jgi:hypothetical protein